MDKENNSFPFESVLDIFAGTGALGLEAVSRGVNACVFIDNAGAAVKNIKENISLLGLDEDRNDLALTVIKDDAMRAVAKLDGHFDLVFIDGPYGKLALTEKVMDKLSGQNLLREDAVLVVELSSKDDLKFGESFKVINEKIYGDTKVVFLNKQKV